MDHRKEGDMNYIKRELERKFLEADQFFKAVLVIGARQVGKSTMLKTMAENLMGISIKTKLRASFDV